MLRRGPTGTSGPWRGAIWNAIKNSRNNLPQRIELQPTDNLTDETVMAVGVLATSLANITRQEAMPTLLSQNFAQLCTSLTALIQVAGIAGVRFLGETAYLNGIAGRPLGEWFRRVDQYVWKASKKAKHKEESGKVFPNVGISIPGYSTLIFYDINNFHKAWNTMLSSLCSAAVFSLLAFDQV